ncbi:MAG: DNA polymerase III subunit gamma/tau [Candidatus Omnitrophica bacterium]|nr:DNA polymerase III subunit gamma/tau [Candidatus Omnitrophota bacterium]
MSYIVFARKYRPQTFKEVIGQDHITEIMEKAIAANKVAHAYLFTGPRGVGKTSCARILAKSLNCEKGPTITPCGQCTSCIEITKGSSFDVLEIDGASNRGIDEIRNLRENVKYASGYARYKIYIIDEVHMLTSEAFNALLKTLEEPPEHVKFIFATTEPNKVPSTILSRCQRFDFKRILLKTIVEILEDICKSEHLGIDQDALYAIAKAAQGGLRDALTVLDQVSALSDKQINAHDVTSMLGLVETELLFSITDALAKNDCSTALEILDQIIDKGKDIRQMSKDLIEHFRHLMILRIGETALGKMIDYPANIKTLLLEQSKKFSLKQIINAIDLFIQANDMARVTESFRLPLEVAFAKLTYQPAKDMAGAPAAATLLKEMPIKKDVEQVKSAVQPPEKKSPIKILSNNRGQIDIGPAIENNDEPSEIVQPEVKIEVVPVSGVLSLKLIKQKWGEVTHTVSKKKMSVATFLQDGVPLSLTENILLVGFPKDCIFNKESLEHQDNLKIVEAILNELFGESIRIKYQLVDEVLPKEEDSSVQDVVDAFGGEVVGRWHEE